MARSRVLALVIATAGAALACQAIVGLDNFKKVECTVDCGADAAPDVAVDAGPDVILFGEAGVANRWVKWPMPNPKDAETTVNVASYDAAGTFPEAGPAIYDTLTKLTWTKGDLGTMTFTEAREKCASVGLRLPTRIELVSILDYTRGQPALEQGTWAGAGGVYWTQSPLPSKTEVWIVDFGASIGVTKLSVASTALVRCVQ